MLKRIKKRIKVFKVRKANIKSKKRITKFSNSIASCGENLVIFGEQKIYSSDRLVIGSNCKLNDNVYINARSGVTIGDNVTISYGAKIISTGYDMEKFMNSGERVHSIETPVYIGNYCWICAGATILPGVKITGEKVVVAADAVVTKDIKESKVIVAGNPARLVKRY